MVIFVQYFGYMAMVARHSLQTIDIWSVDEIYNPILFPHSLG